MVPVPGSFEIPLVASRLARSGDFDAVVCQHLAEGFDFIKRASFGECRIKRRLKRLYGFFSLGVVSLHLFG